VERHRLGGVRVRDRARGHRAGVGGLPPSADRPGRLSDRETRRATMYEDRARLASLWEAERELFRRLHPRSGELAQRARAHLPHGVPMLWMAKWPGDWPVHVAHASGAHFTCAD